ncbi:MAG: hypothetical protein IID46_09085 [Planctomycetes bacterium]|nr:hypothetical protein [Planctomycetota bacterium]
MSSSSPFDFTLAMRRLCEDVAVRLPEMSHIRMNQVAVTFAQARRRVSYGLQAKLTPMRFEYGNLTTQRSGRLWTVERLFDGDTEILYILTFYLPRFLNQSFREKMVTVLHELHHISPEFDGDIRRMPGRYHVHSHSQKNYDRQMENLVDKYLSLSPPKECYSFLKSRFRTIHRRHRGVVGLQVSIPKLIPVPDSKSA